jgi:2-haloacid dehalogenase
MMSTGKHSVILLDVNDTLLNMKLIKENYHAFKPQRRLSIVVYNVALIFNCTGRYHNFSEIAHAPLHMAAKALGQDTSEADVNEVLLTIRELPPHRDVEDGLTLLKDAGFQLAALSNSPAETLNTQFRQTGLEKYFEQILSVDEIKTYKPSLETYRHAARRLDVKAEEMVFIAAHGWDITGATYAGLKTCLIERQGTGALSSCTKTVHHWEHIGGCGYPNNQAISPSLRPKGKPQPVFEKVIFIKGPS